MGGDERLKAKGKRLKARTRMTNPVLQSIAIVCIGSAMALICNSARSRNSLKLTREYFHVLDGEKGTEAREHGGTEGSSTERPAIGGTREESEALVHPFTTVTLDQVVDLYLSEEFGLGEVVFIDARDHAHFTEAHIPGAIHIDRYNSDKHFSIAESDLDAADVIVVYCGGGECEDSIYLASELVELRKVPIAKIRLFEQGMEAWEGDGLEIEGTDQDE